ncbi:MAG: hypothetical protein COB33_014240 [Thiotrichaceae bacterium]|nr:hypothetical protein [Thiotrichaceae bacterium]PCI15044.1 MAG: hypothetical protein COB71_00445 [Thiotrichales bacterium]
MRKRRSFILLSAIAFLLLIAGCASAPEGTVDEHVPAPEPSLQSIGSSEPKNSAEEESLLLEDSATEIESQGAVPSADMLHKKSEPQSDDMERLD